MENNYIPAAVPDPTVLLTLTVILGVVEDELEVPLSPRPSKVPKVKNKGSKARKMGVKSTSINTFREICGGVVVV